MSRDDPATWLRTMADGVERNAHAGNPPPQFTAVMLNHTARYRAIADQLDAHAAEVAEARRAALEEAAQAAAPDGKQHKNATWGRMEAAVRIRALSPVPAAAPDALNGARPIAWTRDQLGRFVREAWVRWAQTQPNPKASWLLPYDDLAEPDKEADRQIGEAVARWTLIGDASSHAMTEMVAAAPDARDAEVERLREALNEAARILVTPADLDCQDSVPCERNIGALKAWRILDAALAARGDGKGAG